ncbi:hypothetical protein GCM10022289_22040 [Pedobacter jeongneungensis]|uniref:Uncharacterized protein n=1 Tax=Pedobacter jeongneungensis TaxID=947309 RepID=A0ABP8BF18_9SPHI
MFLDQYEYFAKNNFLTYQFTSKGKNGAIEKIVQYSKLTIPGVGIVYNLGFGDLTSDGRINDVVNSNNGDMEKVLSTVANTIYDFIAHYPNQFIFAHGSTPIRTKLYQRKISQMLQIISTEFEVYGLEEAGWVEFTGTEEYKAFLIKKK